MEGFILFLHILVCSLLIIVVLLQSGKSADLAGAFGGYGSQSTFGPRGAANILSKLTTILAILFMVLTLLLMIISTKKSSPKSAAEGLEKVKQEQREGDQKKKSPEKKTSGETDSSQSPN